MLFAVILQIQPVYMIYLISRVSLCEQTDFYMALLSSLDIHSSYYISFVIADFFGAQEKLQAIGSNSRPTAAERKPE